MVVVIFFQEMNIVEQNLSKQSCQRSLSENKMFRYEVMMII